MRVLTRSFKQAAEAGQTEALTPAGLLFYPRVFLPQFGLLAGLLCAWGLWALRREPGIRMFVRLSLPLPFVLYSVIQNKNLRYTLPILPAAALVTAVGIQALDHQWRRRLIAVCLAAAALQISMTAFALPPPPIFALFLTPLPISFPPRPAARQEDPGPGDLARARGRGAPPPPA